MILPMNFDGGRVKDRGKRNFVLCLCRQVSSALSGLYSSKAMSSAFLENFFEFTFNTPRPA